jgi:hypothetical protein
VKVRIESSRKLIPRLMGQNAGSERLNLKEKIQVITSEQNSIRWRLN